MKPIIMAMSSALLAGCVDIVDASTFNTLEPVCDNNNGLDRIAVYVLPKSYDVFCNDGAKFNFQSLQDVGLLLTNRQELEHGKNR